MSDLEAKQEPRILKGALPDGQQVLVTLWPEGDAEVAFKLPGDTRWGPATPLKEEK